MKSSVANCSLICPSLCPTRLAGAYLGIAFGIMRVKARGYWQTKSKMMRNAGLFHDAVRCVTRQYLVVDRKIALCDWAEPDLVIAFAAPDRDASVIFENALHVGRKGFRHYSAATA